MTAFLAQMVAEKDWPAWTKRVYSERSLTTAAESLIRFGSGVARQHTSSLTSFCYVTHKGAILKQY
jgi:hypothetical protein